VLMIEDAGRKLNAVREARLVLNRLRVREV
jgi:hypothetical protein